MTSIQDELGQIIDVQSITREEIRESSMAKAMKWKSEIPSSTFEGVESAVNTAGLPAVVEMLRSVCDRAYRPGDADQAYWQKAGTILKSAVSKIAKEEEETYDA